jgi:fucose permease
MAVFFLCMIYLSFISLGLPDSMLGAAWPAMRAAWGAPLGQAGSISLVVAGGTVVSSLFSGRVIRRFGTGRVTAFSVLMTACALLGISLASGAWWLYIMAVPLGLGAGAVDAGLNAYVAKNYKARHMNWLHCFWGIGATLGPVIMGAFVSRGNLWQGGYRTVSAIQFGLVLILFFSLPLWRREEKLQIDAPSAGHASAFGLPGVKWTLVTFFLYCSLEIAAGLWCASFLVELKGLEPAQGAWWASLFYAGITAGRFLSGFLTFKMTGKQLIRLGLLLILLGAGLLLLPGEAAAAGMALMGLGCAPIFPALLHETPARFGQEHAQELIGIQMASAYIGSTLMPAVLGQAANQVGIQIYPWYLMGVGFLMFLCTERINAIIKKRP